MRTERKAGTGLTLAVISAGTFGTSGSFASSLINAGWSPGAAVAARVTTAALMLAIPTLIIMRGRWHILRRNLRMVALYGLIAVAGCQVLYFNALQHLSVGVALLLEYLGVLLVVGWMWMAHGHRPRKLTIMGAATAMLGLVLVLDLLGDNHLDPIGVFWGLLAAAALAVYFVLSSHIDPELPPAALASTGMAFGAAILWAVGAVGIVPLHRGADTVDFAGHRTSWLVPIFGLSFVAAVIAYATGIEAARILGPKLASFLAMTEVIFAVFFAWLLLDQLPTTLQLFGGVFIVAGVAFVRLDELHEGEPDEPAAVFATEPPLTHAA